VENSVRNKEEETPDNISYDEEEETPEPENQVFFYDTYD